MPIQLSAPVMKESILERSDVLLGNKGDPTRISVRQASQGDYERRNGLFSEWARVRRLDAPAEERFVQSFQYEVVKRMEVFLTLSACNILDEDGKDLFQFKNGRIGMSEADFKAAWGKLPLVLAGEIHEKVVFLNPTWGPEGEERLVDS